MGRIMSILGLKNHLNLFGLIIGVLLSSFWNESVFINEIIWNSNQDDGSSNDEASAASRHLLQERLDICSTKLQNITVTKQNIQKQLELQTTAAICTFLKTPHHHQNSLYYIDEFVDYHLALGFQSIYIYYYHGNDVDVDVDDDDDDSILSIKNWANSRNPNRIILNHLLPAAGGDGGNVNNTNTNHHETLFKKCLEDQQQVDNKQVHDSTTTTTTTTTATRKKLYKNDWIAYLDINEFLVLKKSHSNIVDMLQDVTTIQDDNEAGLVALSRFSFIVNDTQQIEYEPTPVLKRFQYRLKQPDSNVKITIAKTTTTNQILLQEEEEEEADYTKGGHHQEINDVATDIAVIHYYYYYYYETLSSLQEEEEEMITIFDDTAWKFLYTSVPLYGKYN